jgi:TonB family protein
MVTIDRMEVLALRRALLAGLLSCFALTAAAATPKPNDNAPAATTATEHRVTTGIIAPIVDGSAMIHITDDAALETLPQPAKMLVRVNLDASGNPTDVRVLESLSPNVDARLIAAVRQLHWHPATLDHQAIPMTVNLTVDVQH